METIFGLIVFSVLILVHELGHYVAAKSCGIPVPTFSLGMGPAIFKKQAWGTEWMLSAIPVGGYIRISDEDSDSWKQLIAYLAGPLASIFVPVLVVIGVCWFNHADAAKALRDLFLAMWQICQGTIHVIWGLATNIVKTSSEVNGPVGIVKVLSRSKDWVDYVYYGVNISIAIGFFNLLPIPPLDGGRVVFILADIIAGRKLDERIVVYVSGAGVTFLLGLMAVGTYNDIFVR